MDNPTAIVDADAEQPTVLRHAPALFGHPRGLTFIAGTELWERISFAGMQALLVLYMVEHLFQPGRIERVAGLGPFRAMIESITGPLPPQALASQIFGLYVGLVYLIPVFGGMLGDRVLGRRRAVVLGALLMTAGHFFMTFEPAFLLALFLLVIGAGTFRGNLASQIGDLYSRDDRRRMSAFQIYYGLLNTGGFVAPLVTGILSQAYGWHYGFAFAGIGMLIGLIVYLCGNRYLPPDLPRATGTGVSSRLTPNERATVAILVLMLPMLTLFWVAQAQVWNTYNLWARDHVDLVIHGWTMPVPWLQAVDALATISLVPPLLLFWKWQAKRSSEPDELTKLAIGCLVFAVAVAWLASSGSSLVADYFGKVPLAWVLAFHLLSSVGYIYFAPTAIAVFSEWAPSGVNAIMIGVYYLSMFCGSTISGRLGGLYEQMPTLQFWLVHAAIVATGGLLMLVFAPLLRRELARRATLSATSRQSMT